MNIEMKFAQFLIKTQSQFKRETFSNLIGYIKAKQPSNDELIDYLRKEMESVRVKHKNQMKDFSGKRTEIFKI